MHASPRRSGRGRSNQCQRGLAMVEVFIVATLIGLALMFHAASTVSGQQLLRAEESHSTALQVARHFLERMRTDPDWDTLYTRLADQMDLAPSSTGQPLTSYYDDFEVPEKLLEATVFVEVPRAASAGGGATDPLVLREDILATRFALPYDVNGDGVIDDKPHDADYVILPVILSFHWASPSGAPQTLRLSTYLRGPR